MSNHLCSGIKIVQSESVGSVKLFSVNSDKCNINDRTMVTDLLRCFRKFCFGSNVG